MAEYKGIDISTWQGANVDFNKVKGSGIQFAILRSGFGGLASQKDRQFENNYAKAKAVGLPVGTYWYSYATSVESARREAKACLEVIKGKQFEYPIYFDLEDPTQANLGKDVLSDMIVAFCSEIENAGYFAGLYSNLYWLTSKLDYNKIKRFSIWLAQWTSKPTYSNPFAMWQYSSKGSVPGISGNVDMNISYKDFPTEIKKLGLNGFKVSEAPKPVTPTPSKKSIDEIAKEVINGKWGNGEARKSALTEAGYDYTAVQNKVNELVGAKPVTPTPAKKSVDEIAKEVINGNWGNGSDRKNRLTNAGYDYSAVQKRVDEMLGSKTTVSNKKSIDEIAREVIKGLWGNGNDRKNKLAAAGYDYSAVQNRVNELLK